MSAFDGFPQEVFECCEESEKIRIPINSLKKLRSEIEPEFKKMNSNLSGHVSRTKIPGTNDYNEWAWLYFNTIGPGAYRHSQLTVNISPSRVYVGVNLRRRSECRNFQNEIRKTGNEWLLEQIVNTLSGREWIILTTEDRWWEKQVPRRYSPHELRGLLLDPQLYWINACFERNEPLVRTARIADEILQIFKELYNIYALTSYNKIIPQPRPKSKVYKPKISIDSREYTPKSDEEIRSDVQRFLSSLRTKKEPGKTHMPGKSDQYFIKRKALDLELKPQKLHWKGIDITIYSNRDIKLFHGKILTNYSNFRQLIDRIRKSLELPEDFLKVMYVDPKSDARYSKDGGTNSIFLNLARFETNKDMFLWLFTVARELSYIKAPRLGYRFINQLRDILTLAVSKWQFRN